MITLGISEWEKLILNSDIYGYEGYSQMVLHVMQANGLVVCFYGWW